MRNSHLLLALGVLAGVATAQPIQLEPQYYDTVFDWALQTNHTKQLSITEVVSPDIADRYDDPAWVGTVFAITDRVWDLMARMDGQGTFDRLLANAEANATYSAGLKKLLAYNIHPDEALTYLDLLRLVEGGQGSLSTLLDNERIGLKLSGVSGGTGVSTITLVPAGQEIGNVTVVFGPDVFAGNATVLAVDKVLLPAL
ncbi:fasciclin [Micractinium conductrix]|uniref:Fasciclin n=1 Tax=Micractinium conductrix TaxID=554055 RepID=A0A2P6VS60_9CHLO|nr:fasciclin [Micractinium conductrix]|eukprot:PSC76938.1 fasciclin [Micractinium conductrix]